MFEEQNPASKTSSPVEDIFAQAQPPANGLRQVSELPAQPPPIISPTTWPEVKPRRRWLIIIIAAVFMLLLAAGAWYWWSNRPEPEVVPSTENTEVQPPSQTNNPAQPTNEQAQVPTAEADSDGDGLTDGEEVGFGTSTTNPDSDGDGLFDGEEIRIYATNPLSFDSDGDGYGDGEEIRSGYNPLGPGRLLQLPTEQSTEPPSGQ